MDVHSTITLVGVGAVIVSAIAAGPAGVETVADLAPAAGDPAIGLVATTSTGIVAQTIPGWDALWLAEAAPSAERRDRPA